MTPPYFFFFPFWFFFFSFFFFLGCFFFLSFLFFVLLFGPRTVSAHDASAVHDASVFALVQPVLWSQPRTRKGLWVTRKPCPENKHEHWPSRGIRVISLSFACDIGAVISAANFYYSRQPWSSYAVHLTTLSPPALLGDLLLVWLCHRGTAPWGDVLHSRAMNMLLLWVFTSKFIKLLGHYIRYPVDVFLLPISVLFGYFHGAIKMYAVMTLNVVSNVFGFFRVN